MNGAAHIVACAHWCREVLLTNGLAPEHVSVHRQALPLGDRKRRLRLPLTDQRPIRLGFFGRFAWNKGPDLFFEGVQRVNRRGLAVQAEVVGPIIQGDQRYAEGLMTRYAAHASYLGVKRGAALTEWIDSLHLAVIPSRWLETGPLTLLEAWDRGVPVLGTNRGGIREFMIQAGMESLLFAPEDPDALADAVFRAVAWSGADQPEVEINGMTMLGEQMESLYRAAI